MSIFDKIARHDDAGQEELEFELSRARRTADTHAAGQEHGQASSERSAQQDDASQDTPEASKDRVSAADESVVPVDTPTRFAAEEPASAPDLVTDEPGEGVDGAAPARPGDGAGGRDPGALAAEEKPLSQVKWSGIKVARPGAGSDAVVDDLRLKALFDSLPRDTAIELTARSRKFGDDVRPLLEGIAGEGQASAADVRHVSTMMSHAYIMTRLAAVLHGADGAAPARATFPTNAEIDALFAEQLAKDEPFLEERLLAHQVRNAAPGAEFTEGLGALMKGSGIVMNGDDVEEPTAQTEPSLSERMRAIGFPPRPKLWPAIMAWPMQPDFDLLLRGGATPDKVKEYSEAMTIELERMLLRAQQVDAYIRHNNPVDERHGIFNRVVSRRRLDAAMDDPHYGIRWACLIDEKATRPSSAIVREWAQNSARTTDNGLVVAMRNYVAVRDVTQQAVALSVQEGVARGWGSLRMQGDEKFVRFAIEAAKQANIKATIIENCGPFGLFKRKHIVMPTPPGVQNAVPHVESRNLGIASGDPRARQPLSPAEIEAGNLEARKQAIARLATLPAAEAVTPDPVADGDSADPFASSIDRELAELAAGGLANERNEVITEIIEEEELSMAWVDDGAQGPVSNGPRVP